METELVNRDEQAFKRLYNIDHPELKTAEKDTLREYSEKLLLCMDDIVSKADAEKRALTDDENRAYNFADLLRIKINREVDRRNENKPRSLGLGDIRVSGDGVDNTNPREKKTVGFIGATYRQLFPGESYRGRTGGGEFKGLNDFLTVVSSGKYDPRLEQRDMIEGVGALGGNIIPSDFLEQIWSVPLEQSLILPRARVFPIRKGTSITIPQWDSLDHSTNIAGFTLVWEAEEAVRSDQDGQLTDVEVTAYQAMIYCSASNRLLYDGINFENQLGEVLVNALGFGLDDYYLNGNGVAKPLGIRHAPSRITVDRASSNQITYADVLSMFSRLHPACHRNACWITTPTTVPQLCQLRDSGNNSVWVNNAAAGMPPTILNVPVLFTEKLPSMGNEADLILCDPTQYAITPRQDIVVEKSNAPKWHEDKTSFRIKVRTNGMPLWKSVCTPRDSGGVTLSWAIVLR